MSGRDNALGILRLMRIFHQISIYIKSICGLRTKLSTPLAENGWGDGERLISKPGASNILWDFRLFMIKTKYDLFAACKATHANTMYSMESLPPFFPHSLWMWIFPIAIVRKKDL